MKSKCLLPGVSNYMKLRLSEEEKGCIRQWNKAMKSHINLVDTKAECFEATISTLTVG